MIENKSGGPGGDRTRDSGAVSYGYDDNGNQTLRGSDTFTYDHENRLTQTVLGGVTSSSAYNGDGVRMSHTVGAATTNYEWDLARGLPVILDDGTNTYVYGLDLIASIDGAGVETYFTYDGLGSTADLTDDTGTVTDTYSYDVFGATTQVGSSSNYWTFTGEQHDGSEDLYFLRARYYDSATGRFLSQDPLGIGNWYSYVGNNPMNYVDPSGLIAHGDIIDAVRQCIADPLDCTLEVVSPLSTIVAIMDLVPLSPWYIEVANAVLTQITIFASDCSTAMKIALTLGNALGLEVGILGTLLIVPAAAGGPLGVGAVITATFVIEASLTTATTNIIDGCSNVAYADPGGSDGGGSKE